MSPNLSVAICLSYPNYVNMRSSCFGQLINLTISANLSINVTSTIIGNWYWFFVIASPTEPEANDFLVFLPRSNPLESRCPMTIQRQKATILEQSKDSHQIMVSKYHTAFILRRGLLYLSWLLRHWFVSAPILRDSWYVCRARNLHELRKELWETLNKGSLVRL